jgi:hydrogenase maturation factor
VSLTQPSPGTPREPHCDPDDGCITCGDVAEPMRVLGIDRERRLALCSDADGDHHTVEIALVEPVAVGDELLVHAGTGISNLGPPVAHPAARRGAAEEATGL